VAIKPAKTKNAGEKRKKEEKPETEPRGKREEKERTKEKTGRDLDWIRGRRRRRPKKTGQNRGAKETQTQPIGRKRRDENRR